MTNLKIIVKVGKKSKLRFSHSKVYRAIDTDSLNTLSNQVKDCHIVVIEHISKEEEDETREFIKSFVDRDTKNIVLFYIPEEDDITSGLADELDYNIYMSLETLYKEIYNRYGFNVSTFLKDKKELNKDNNYEIDGISDIFGDVNEDFNNELKDTIENTETELGNKDELEVTNSDNIEENKIEAAQDNEETYNKYVTDDETQLEIARLKMKLTDATYDYESIQKDMVDAIKRTEHLENIIKVLTDEKETLQKTFNDIVLSDVVIEDPISLSEYEELKKEATVANNRIKELEKHIQSLNETINLNNDTISNNENTIKDIQSKLNRLNETIDSGEIHRDIIDKHKAQLGEITEERDNLQAELLNLQAKYDNLLINIKSTEENISLNVKYRQYTTDLFKTALSKVLEKDNKISELNANILDFDTKLNSINEQLNNATRVIDEKQSDIERLNDEVTNLINEKNTAIEEKDTLLKRSEISSNYSEQEIIKLNEKIVELENKLKSTEEKLSTKENQYNAMIEKNTLESSSSRTLVETNKSLEQINKSLRDKLNIVIKEAEQYKIDRESLKHQLDASKLQCKNLNDAVQALSGSGIGNVNALVNNTVKPINYSGNAQIIPVFGSGSFGITTTAMSLAYKLCMTSKVLYIDLDLVSPRADSWFGKMPMISSIPGVSGNGLNDTGMGIFLCKGISVVSGFLDNIIIKGCEVTKGGGIDYISGCYSRIEQSKIAEADFTTFLSMLGNLYNYIIIDMGKLGTNETTDSLIKAITDISYKAIVVTTSEKFEVRDFKNKLVENKVNPDKLAWLLNMCESTTVDEKVRQYINPIKYGIMLNDHSLRGNKIMFMKNKVNRDKLDLFLNSTVFGGK